MRRHFRTVLFHLVLEIKPCLAYSGRVFQVKFRKLHVEYSSWSRFTGGHFLFSFRILSIWVVIVQLVTCEILVLFDRALKLQGLLS